MTQSLRPRSSRRETRKALRNFQRKEAQTHGKLLLLLIAIRSLLVFPLYFSSLLLITQFSSSRRLRFNLQLEHTNLHTDIHDDDVTSNRDNPVVSSQLRAAQSRQFDDVKIKKSHAGSTNYHHPAPEFYDFFDNG